MKLAFPPRPPIKPPLVSGHNLEYSSLMLLFSTMPPTGGEMGRTDALFCVFLSRHDFFRTSVAVLCPTQTRRGQFSPSYLDRSPGDGRFFFLACCSLLVLPWNLHKGLQPGNMGETIVTVKIASRIQRLKSIPLLFICFYPFFIYVLAQVIAMHFPAGPMPCIRLP